MTEYIKIKNKKKGSALAYVLVMIVIITTILTSLLGYISSQINFSKDRVERERAFQIAEAGIYFYRWYLAHEISGKTSQQIADFWNNENPYGVDSDYEAEYIDPEGAAIGKYSLHVEKPDEGSTIVSVVSTGFSYKKPSAKRKIKVRFRRPSWSENMVLANDNIRFGEGTVINGKIFSNLGIRMDGVANNIVSSAVVSYDDPDHDGGFEFGVHTHKNIPPAIGKNDTFRPLEAPPNIVSSRTDVFTAGRIFPEPQIDFTSVVSDLAFMRSNADIKYDNSAEGRKITLKADGTFDTCKVSGFNSNNEISEYQGIVIGATGSNAWRNGTACQTYYCCLNTSCPLIQTSTPSKGRCTTMTTQNIPDAGVIFVAENVWVDGIIDNKKVTIVAAELADEPNYGIGMKNIYLTNNLLYTNTDGKDIIGLIAQKNIEVTRNSQNYLTIDAALLAKDGRVGRSYYDGIVKNTITINGSIATNLRYGFAYTDNTGYINRILNFDNNLLYYPPPFFPTGTEYAIDQWDEL